MNEVEIQLEKSWLERATEEREKMRNYLTIGAVVDIDYLSIPLDIEYQSAQDSYDAAMTTRRQLQDFHDAIRGLR